MGKAEAHVPFREDSGENGEEPSEDVERIAGIPRKMLFGLAVLTVYATLFERIGHFLATLVFMFVWQMIVEKESWLKSLSITAIATITMYTLFHYLLNVPLPKGPRF